jgi:hypothetical protein
MRFDAFHPWSLLGLLFLGLGGLGVVLPLLPTTPFVLLAAGCFARSSPRLHRWLLDSQLFGPILRDWEQHRCVPRRAKVVALVTMLGVGGSSILFAVPPGWPRWAGLGLVAVGCGVLLSLRTCPADAGASGRGLRQSD